MTLAPSTGTASWTAAEQVMQDLRLSRTTLYRLRREGLLKPGVHFLRTTPGRTSRILWSPGAIREAMAGWTEN